MPAHEKEQCSRCRRWSEGDEAYWQWYELTEDDKVVGIVCPGCRTGDEIAAEIRAQLQAGQENGE